MPHASYAPAPKCLAGMDPEILEGPGVQGSKSTADSAMLDHSLIRVQ